MFLPRTIRTSLDWQDADGAKLYTISTDGASVDQRPFLVRLAEVKRLKTVPWSETAHFAIFHRGVSSDYLVLAWWGNDNELFNSVSVSVDGAWVESADRYSFCLYDMEVFWDERNTYVDTVYCATPSLALYRQRRRKDWIVSSDVEQVSCV